MLYRGERSPFTGHESFGGGIYIEGAVQRGVHGVCSTEDHAHYRASAT